MLCIDALSTQKNESADKNAGLFLLLTSVNQHWNAKHAEFKAGISFASKTFHHFAQLLAIGR